MGFPPAESREDSFSAIGGIDAMGGSNIFTCVRALFAMRHELLNSRRRTTAAMEALEQQSSEVRYIRPKFIVSTLCYAGDDCTRRRSVS
jgi:hypothetical protein